MGATNRTTNYNLPQFVATDVPTWLTDVNGAMSTIDTSIKGVADSVTVVHGEVNAVDARVDTTNGNVTTLAQRVTTAEQNISTLQQGLGVANSNISANADKIGTATLQTTAQTLSGAINEIRTVNTVIKFDKWHNLLPYRADNDNIYIYLNGVYARSLRQDGGSVDVSENVTGTTLTVLQVYGSGSTGNITLSGATQHPLGLELIAPNNRSFQNTGMIILSGTMTV